nr:G protein-coupled receptor [Proales similis]
MAENTLTGSNIVLLVFSALYLVISFILNFSFLVTLLKIRRLNRVDKSNYFLTHLILVDLICTFFIMVPNGYAIYDSRRLSREGCIVQTFFTTFFIGMTFTGLLLLAVERFVKYQFPIAHINFFTKRLTFDENDEVVGHSIAYKTMPIIAGLWLFNIFFSFVPFFQNFGDVQYFSNQSQCDYIYERFEWWIWLFFFLLMTVPFLVSLVLYGLTFRLIYKSDRIIKMKKSQFELTHARERRALGVEFFVNGLDMTRQPVNEFYYTHIIDPDDENLADEQCDYHVRNQLLSQYKYSSERSKAATFCLITVLSYFLIFPTFFLHFYRTYENLGSGSQNYADPAVLSRGLYTTFVWISYLLLVLKSALCLFQNRFYRNAFYQATNSRGFSGKFDFEKNMRKVKEVLEIGNSSKETQSSA